MHFLYGSKKTADRQLVATFDSEQQLKAYVSWATLRRNTDGTLKFEQGSALAPYLRCESSTEPRTDTDPEEVPHNPAPSML